MVTGGARLNGFHTMVINMANFIWMLRHGVRLKERAKVGFSLQAQMRLSYKVGLDLSWISM